MRGLVLLLIVGARASGIVVEVEVNGKMQELRASPHGTRAAAHAFCIKHNLTDWWKTWPAARCSPRNWSRRARYPLPSEKLLPVRGGVGRPDCGTARAARAAALPRRSGFFGGWCRRNARIAVDVAEHGRTFVAFDHSLVNDGVLAKRWMAWASRSGEPRLPSAAPGSAGSERSQHMISP